MEEIIENMKFSFRPEVTIEESKKDGSWLRIGGTALVEGTSKNNNVYTNKNLKENAGKEFKWLFGHPDSPEEHVVGSGALTLEEGKLFHEGKIRNTAKHPDVVEQVRDKFLGPSIHASVKRAIRKEGKYHLEGLSIDGIGLVAFQGVKQASIDYAIAESFEKELFDRKESTLDEKNNNDKGDNKMSEEEKAPVEPVAEEPKAEVPSEEKAEESTNMKEELQAVKEELKTLRESKKTALVESIVAINKELKAEDLMKESDEKLNLMKEYESKLSVKKESVAIVEGDEEEAKPAEEVVEEKDGSYSVSEAAYEKFNAELRERVR